MIYISINFDISQPECKLYSIIHTEIHKEAIIKVCPEHVHLSVSIPPKISISSFIGYLKGEYLGNLCQASRTAK